MRKKKHCNLLYNIVFFILVLISIFSLTSCKGKPWDLYKAKKLSSKNDLAALKEARNIYLKYANSDINAKEGLKAVDKYIGEYLYLNQNFNDAIPYLKESLNIDPNQYLVNYYLGVCYANLYSSEVVPTLKKEYKNLAIFHYKKAISLAPNQESPHYALGVFYYFALKDYDNAEIEIDNTLKINPKNVRALFVKAQLQYLNGELQNCYNTYQSILQLLPKTDGRREQVLKNLERLKNEISSSGK